MTSLPCASRPLSRVVGKTRTEEEQVRASWRLGNNIIHSEVCMGMRPKMHTYFRIYRQNVRLLAPLF